MTVVNMTETSYSLKQLVDLAASGEEVVISEHGKPVARVISIAPTGISRQPGTLKGQIWIADDFDVLPEEVAAAFRGERP